MSEYGATKSVGPAARVYPDDVPVARGDGAIKASLDNLLMQAEACAKLAEELTMRLEPVLEPLPPTPANGQREGGTRATVPLVNDLERIGQVLNAVQIRLSQCRSQLAL